MTIVDGETMDKRTGVSLDDCFNLCNARTGCTHFNYYYRFVLDYFLVRKSFECHQDICHAFVGIEKWILAAKYRLTLGQDASS